MSRWGRRALIAGATVTLPSSLALVVACLVASAAGCIDLGGPKSGVVSISSLRIPYPTVVLGDILRDSLGAPAPLSLTAFDASGDPIAGEVVTYFALDSTISVDADGTVHGLFRDSVGGRVVAGAGALQTPAQKIFVSIKPEVATKSDTPTAITFELTTPDTSTLTNWSPALTLTLTGAASAAAQGFIVSYQVIRSPTPATAGVPTVYVGDDAGRTSPRDTTNQQGMAGRRVILRQQAFGDVALLNGTKTDTIIVRATVKYLGADVAGSPIDFIVPVKRK